MKWAKMKWAKMNRAKMNRAVMSLAMIDGFDGPNRQRRSSGAATPVGGSVAPDLAGAEAGQTTVVMALFLATFLLGFVALGIDATSLFHAKRMAQAAADAAALAASEESSYGTTDEQNAANAAATMNGFPTTGTNHATVTIGTPTSGNYSGSTGYVQAVVSKPIQTFFIGMITHQSTMTISARSVAGSAGTALTCVCLEGTTGMDLNMSNDATLSPNSCGTEVNSTSSNAVGIVGGSTLSGMSLGIASSSWTKSANVNNGGSINADTQVVTGLATTCAPTMPTVPSYTSSSCTADPLTHYGNGGSSYSVGPGSTYSTTQGSNTVCYTSLTIGTNCDTVDVQPGIYVITGGELHFESGCGGVSNTGGSGVLFYLVNGANLVIDNGANVNLTAMSSGTYSGILVYQDPGDSAALSIQGGSSTNFNGAIYAPAAGVTLGNGSNTTIDAAIVAQTLTMTGGTTLASSAQTNMGSLNTAVGKLAE